MAPTLLSVVLAPSSHRLSFAPCAACPALSGKLQACARLLDHIRVETTDKIVVVAPRLAVLRRIRQYVIDTFDGGESSVWMLHGEVPAKKREQLVEEFNGGTQGLRVCLLISNLAVGINLIGANHLIMLAPAYNPAVDNQAMARCHRGGQKKVCYIYRLLTTGSSDETIIQRQVRKGGLCEMLADGKLPPLHSPDCDLLFKLDEPDCVSRLHTTMPSDSPYADESAWEPRNGPCCGLRGETWLAPFMQELLLEPPCHMKDEAVEGRRAVQCDAAPNADGLSLVSFVLRSKPVGSSERVPRGQKRKVGHEAEEVAAEEVAAEEAAAAQEVGAQEAAAAEGEVAPADSGVDVDWSSVCELLDWT